MPKHMAPGRTLGDNSSSSSNTMYIYTDYKKMGSCLLRLGDITDNLVKSMFSRVLIYPSCLLYGFLCKISSSMLV